MRRTTWFSTLVVGLMLSNVVYALPVPEGDPVLWVSGEITESNTLPMVLSSIPR